MKTFFTLSFSGFAFLVLSDTDGIFNATAFDNICQNKFFGGCYKSQLKKQNL